MYVIYIGNLNFVYSARFSYDNSTLALNIKCHIKIYHL